MTHFSFVGTVFARIFTHRPQTPQRSLQWALVGKHATPSPEPRTAAHTPKRGVFQMGVLSLPSGVLRGSETLRGRVSEPRTLPLSGLGQVCSRRVQESLRDSDAFMRVAVPRRRRPAGLRDPIAVSLTAPMGFAVLLSRFVGTQKIERLFFSYSGAFLNRCSRRSMRETYPLEQRSGCRF